MLSLPMTPFFAIAAMIVMIMVGFIPPLVLGSLDEIGDSPI